MYIGSPCLVFLFRLLSLRNHEAMVLRRGGGGGGGDCEERYFVTSYVCKYLKVSFKTVPSNRTEILVTEFGHSKPKGNFGICCPLSNVPVLGKYCQNG